MTDNLVAENRGVLQMPPLIVQDGEIGVTQTAVFDSDFNVLGPERSEIDGFEHHRLLCRLRNPYPIIHSVSYSETIIAAARKPRRSWLIFSTILILSDKFLQAKRLHLSSSCNR